MQTKVVTPIIYETEMYIKPYYIGSSQMSKFGFQLLVVPTFTTAHTHRYNYIASPSYCTKCTPY